MIKIGDIIEGKISMNSSNSAYFTNEDLSKDIYLSKNKTNKALHLDIVKIKVIQGNGRKFEGEVIEIIERFRTEFVGVIQLSEKYGFFVPDSNKLGIDFFIPLNKINGALDGQKVVAQLTEWKDGAKNPNGKIIKIIGYAGEHETEIHAIMEEFNLSYDFPEDVLAEADAISTEITQDEIDKRRDLRHVTTCGIDPYDSRDADDTIGLEWVNGDAIVSVNIADVSFYVKPNSAIDDEAYLRGTSFYFPDRCVSMLPEKLSNDICSLKSGSDKLCFSAIFRMDKRGKIIERWFGRTIINVNKDYSYEEAQDVIEGGLRNEFKETDQIILELNKIAKNLRKERIKNGVLSLDKPEIKFILDENKKPIDIVFKTSKESNKLIEELMLLTNKEVAKFIKSKGSVCVNRVHEPPTDEKLENLKTFISQFGYDIKISNPDEVKSSLNKLLQQCKGTLEEDLITTLVIRTQQKAIYTTNNLPHFGLNFTDYTQFTSCIRRYSDLISHRILANVLGNDGYPIK